MAVSELQLIDSVTTHVILESGATLSVAGTDTTLLRCYAVTLFRGEPSKCALSLSFSDAWCCRNLVVDTEAFVGVGVVAATEME